jgi:4-hydroxy-2-oxoheptanedioate aldolase
MQRLRQRIRAGEPLLGTFYKSNSPLIVELLGWTGFDFIVIDCEHSNIGYENVESILRTADEAGLSAIVRVPRGTEEHIFHALDSGADGIQIPNMTTVDEFVRTTKIAKYFPLGTRGLSRGTRSARYGIWKNETPYVEYANENTVVAVHIENKEMADHIEEICQIPQIDVVFVGPADMSQSLGIPGKAGNPRIVEIAEHIIKTARKFGKTAGTAVSNMAGARQYLDMGATYILLSSDAGIFADAAQKTVAEFATLKH